MGFLQKSAELGVNILYYTTLGKAEHRNQGVAERTPHPRRIRWGDMHPSWEREKGEECGGQEVLHAKESLSVLFTTSVVIVRLIIGMFVQYMGQNC